MLPFIIQWKKKSLKAYIKSNETINIIVGASKIKFTNWYATERDFLDLTKEKDFAYFFSKKKINRILAEHVLEHLTKEDLTIMLSNLSKYTSHDVTIRIAVPDGFHKSPEYIEQVKPGGLGEGSDDHKHLFNYKKLSDFFSNFNFKSDLIEYWDENGNFHTKYKNDEKGIIRRSFINDARNKDGKPNYTSLIIDFRKK